MARRDIRLDMDIADSSSDSGMAESVTDDDQHFDDNSLMCNTTAGIEANNEFSNPVAMVYPRIEEDFKIEWTDVLNIPMLLTVNPRRIQTDFMGQVHTWRGIDWSVLFRMHQHESAQVGAFFGYDEQPYFLFDTPLRVQFQIDIVDEEGSVIVEGSLFDYTFGGHQHNGRADNGSPCMFPYDQFFKYLRCLHDEMYKAGRAPALNDLKAAQNFCLPVRLHVTLEEVYVPRILPPKYDSKESTGLVGLENLGATCYLNALLQMLYHVNSFRCAVYKLPHEDENLATSTTLALQTVFRNLQTSRSEVTTKDLTVAFGWTSAEAFLQQDVQEMMRVLIDKLEDKMKGTVVDGLTKELFAGRVRSYIKCVNVQYESKREEDFYDIQLDVKGCKNVYESFRKYIEVEMLDGENQYEAGEHGKQDAQKGVIFETFPPVLTVHLKRFDFDLQTMNFTKIHDHYEFPLRLELDAYLASDCPEGSRAVPNNYLLHSVLVHQGDVGGGHYYAYIRPTTDTFNYSMLSVDPATLASVPHRDQQWFKFNDEVVYQVPQREAVDNCYGRKFNVVGFRGGLSSAYMLVYIREAEAPEIMRPVTMADIPASLEERLQAELNTKLAAEKRMDRLKRISYIYFATEQNVSSFTAYSRQDGWLSRKDLVEIPILKDTTKLGALLKIADTLHCNPLEVRLWEIDEDGGSLQLGDDVDLSELAHRVKSHCFYVESVPFGGDESALADFQEAYVSIRQREAVLLRDLREELLSHANLFYSEGDDPVQHCGIGCCNSPIEELKPYGAEVFDKFHRAFIQLRDMLLELFKDTYPDCPQDHMLLFVKVFDPYNLLPQLGVEDDDVLRRCASDEEAEELSDDEEEEEERERDDEAGSGSGSGSGNTGPDGSNGNSNNGNGGSTKASNSLKRRRRSSNQSLPPYMPVKYVGSLLIETNTPVAELAKILQLLIQSLHPSVPEDWQSECQKFRYYCGTSPAQMGAIPMKDVENGVSFSAVTEALRERVFYVDMIPQHPRQLLVPFNITDTRSWMSFQAFKKTITFRPFSHLDAALLQRRQNERAARQALHKSEGGDEAWPAIQSSPGGYSQMGSPLRKRQKSLIRERSGSVSSQQRDRAGSTGSELGVAFNSPGGGRTPLPVNRRSIRGKPFTMLVPLMTRVSELIVRISDELEVDPGHIGLFFVHQVGVNNAVWMRRRFQADPVSMHNCLSRTVKDVLELQKNLLKVSAKCCVFYRIVPYSVLMDAPKVQVHKIIDFLIVDERIRYWRRLYLEHVRQNSNTHRTAEQVTHRVTELPSPVTPKKDSGASMEVEEIQNSATAAGPVMRMSTPPSHAKASRSRASSEAAHHTQGGSHHHSSQRAASIVWPPAPAEYDAAAEGMVTLCAPLETPLSQATHKLRDLLGIPQNMAELEALKLPVSGVHNETVVMSPAQQHLQSSAVRKELCVRPFGTCSDHLRLGDKSGTFTPAFPLLITCIRNEVVNQLLYGSCDASNVMSSFSELGTAHERLYYTGVQYVSPEDALFLHGTHPTVKSQLVSVFSYTLIDHKAEPCDVTSTTEPKLLPFVTYLREDDDYATLARRVAAVTGEKETWQELVLTLAERGGAPTPLPRGAATPVASPVLSGRKTLSAATQFESQADSQATEIDPESTSQSVDPASAGQQPQSLAGVAYNAMAAIAEGAVHAFIGPSPPPPATPVRVPTTPSASVSPPPVETRKGPVWRAVCAKYPRVPTLTRGKLAQTSPDVDPTKTSMLYVGIQRGVVNSVPKTGTKRLGGGGGGIKII